MSASVWKPPEIEDEFDGMVASLATRRLDFGRGDMTIWVDGRIDPPHARS